MENMKEFEWTQIYKTYGLLTVCGEETRGTIYTVAYEKRIIAFIRLMLRDRQTELLSNHKP